MPRVRYPDPLPENIAAALRRVQEGDLVLDVGGHWKPLQRADHVIDVAPYETRADGGRLGSGPERFTRATWHQFDICDGRWPFPDSYFDFAYCGQTLEDVRDPIFVCRELSRVAKRGYVEVPSAWIECVYDVDAHELSLHYPGYEKHRWIVLERSDNLLFIPKQVWQCLFRFIPEELAERYRQDQRIWTTALHWEGSFRAQELIFAGQQTIVPLLKAYFAAFDYGRYQPAHA
jgi:ubiquinone/menaquinone biosynthesis C-methylase UbiE